MNSANEPGCDFPIQNLPFGVYSRDQGPKRIGVAIGTQILDVSALEENGRLSVADKPVFADGVLNPFMALPSLHWSSVRSQIAALLDEQTGDPSLPLIAQTKATLHLPFFVRSFTDFYASKEHATAVGSLFRDPNKALLPNWLHVPVGYNGRASTVVVSDTPIHRPNGQLKAPLAEAPHFGPSDKVDMELEIGAVVGTPSPMGHPITVQTAYDNIFGYVLLNDWSARDIQVWEYQPLGPFQSKAFATTISPWVVTREALEPFRSWTPKRDKPLLPYLTEEAPYNFDIALEAQLIPSDGIVAPLCRTNAQHLYYTPAQPLAHHTSSGCGMETGDLLGSGTISGPTPESAGSLLERTYNGRSPLQVSDGLRTFLEDGDTISISGKCGGEDFGYGIGFGRCRGTLLPAVAFP